MLWMLCVIVVLYPFFFFVISVASFTQTHRHDRSLDVSIYVAAKTPHPCPRRLASSSLLSRVMGCCDRCRFV